MTAGIYEDEYQYDHHCEQCGDGFDYDDYVSDGVSACSERCLERLGYTRVNIDTDMQIISRETLEDNYVFMDSLDYYTHRENACYCERCEEYFLIDDCRDIEYLSNNEISSGFFCNNCISECQIELLIKDEHYYDIKEVLDLEGNNLINATVLLQEGNHARANFLQDKNGVECYENVSVQNSLIEDNFVEVWGVEFNGLSYIGCVLIDRNIDDNLLTILQKPYGTQLAFNLQAA